MILIIFILNIIVHPLHILPPLFKYLNARTQIDTRIDTTITRCKKRKLPNIFIIFTIWLYR